ncbi:hypothetical protein LSG23_09415 [Bacillus velezensis]|uniref:hypothetical protein n=1 Tax=Bacillus velezensis TaxID=492670 RepID=UPI0009880991|nr:hypothetical protein [Bacillus velezensis]AQS44197.1 hypothetical protein BVH55_09870 [Bacillus velezensis]WNR79417.1 hypothetical protein RP314_10920 [Bacillus velezensis]
MILKEIALYEETLNKHLPNETKMVLHYRNVEATENEDKITLRFGVDSLVYKWVELGGVFKGSYKMKMTSLEDETNEVYVKIEKIQTNSDRDLAVEIEFNVLSPFRSIEGVPGIHSLSIKG